MQGFAQFSLNILILLGTHTDANNPKRSIFQLTYVGGLGFKPLPAAIVTTEAIFNRGFVKISAQLQGQGFKYRLAVIGMYQIGKFFGGEGIVAGGNTQVFKVAGIDNHEVTFHVE